MKKVDNSSVLFLLNPSCCNGSVENEMGLTDSEVCDCSNIWIMSHIVNTYPLAESDGGLQLLHSSDKAAVD